MNNNEEIKVTHIMCNVKNKKRRYKTFSIKLYGIDNALKDDPSIQHVLKHKNQGKSWCFVG